MLVVGHDSPLRRGVGHELIERGYPVVVCSGPPGCALSHDDRCVLLDEVDCAVILPSHADRAIDMYLQQCARRARTAVFALQPDFELPPGSVVVGSPSAARIARVVEGLVRAGAA